MIYTNCLANDTGLCAPGKKNTSNIRLKFSLQFTSSKATVRTLNYSPPSNFTIHHLIRYRLLFMDGPWYFWTKIHGNVIIIDSAIIV